MSLGESRINGSRSAVAAQQLVRGWVWFYTLGLPRETREARRAELDSDLWDQAHAAGLRVPGAPAGSASGVLLRCTRGVPADLLWRVVEARTGDSSTDERREMRTFTLRSSLGLATIILMAVLVAAAIAITVVHTIEWDNPGTRIMEPWIKIVLGSLLLAAGFVLAASGFGLIRRAPWLGAVLAVSGVWMVALLFYWMLYPVLLFIAAGTSVFAIGWAKRRTEVDARMKAEDD